MNIDRSRSWRRYQYRLKKGRGMGSDEFFKPVKNWKHLYVRKEKLNRAKQLGFDYPRMNSRQLFDRELPLDD